MQVAAGSWSWHAPYYEGRWSLIDLPAAAAALGITWLEANDFMLPPPRFSRLRRPLLRLLPGAPPELWRYSRASLEALRQAAAAHDTHFLAWTVNSDFAVAARHWPAQRLYLRRGVAAARHLRARFLRVNLGGSPDSPPLADELVIHRLAQFVEDSRRWYPGLHITVENHWGLSSDIQRHLRLLDAARQLLAPAHMDYFGCCFDPGNLPPAQRASGWPALARRANHFHLKTTAFDDTGADCQLPYPHLFALLQEAGYQGPATIEYQGDGEPAAGVTRSLHLLDSASS